MASSNLNYVRSRRASSHVSATSKLLEHDSDRRRITLPNLSPSLTSRQTDTSYCYLQSQWEILMRKFSEDCKNMDHCCTNVQSEGEKLMCMLSKAQTTHLRSDGEALTCENRPLKKFSTGSTYEGTWDALGMCGYGIYTFPNGAVYRGEFEDNMFHGDGEMRYPDGTTLRGKWNYGKLIDKTVIFNDGVHYADKNWKYCKDPDRRYSREFKDGIQAGGISYMTNEKTLRELPDGKYDVGDGVYDPDSGTINDYDDNTHMIRFPSKELGIWIEEHCRKAPDNSVGPQPDLYKTWQDVTMKATAPPLPECVSDEDSDPNDIYSNANYPESTLSSMMRSRPSLTSYSKHSKLKFDPNKPHVDSFRPEPCESQISKEEHLAHLLHNRIRDVGHQDPLA